MPETFLLVDYENVCDFALSGLPEGYHVKIFLGRSQKSIPSTLVSEAQPLGERVEWIQIEGDSKNNLDFHLSYYLGKLHAAHPTAAFIVVSKDKGFDPLIRHIVRLGGKIERKAELTPQGRNGSPAGATQYDRVYSILAKISPNSRPRRSKTLAQFIAANLQKKSPDAEVREVVEALKTKRMVSESDNALSYHF